MDNFEQAREFHQVFDEIENNRPHVLTNEEAGFRMGFKIEEIVEFLYASAAGDKECFEQLVEELSKSVKQAKEKIMVKHVEERMEVPDVLVGQVDAMLDLLYFVNGTFVRMGVDPRPLSKIVHQANMGKLFPDGKPHYDAVTGKVLKPSNWEKDFAPEEKIKAELLKQLKKK
ncbi:HAD family hydrolase [Vagococcus xieshaowenii]|uniref:HAD family hydrolase n=1 Tax=Vagococcus xieshaowenii TaxID=2562451 RepID=A0AAJ5EEQ9_9ENTE|nr:HAD family hydrolase [Vagococcus xieshaowenii]QCA28044.1 HAD family hydrolase [Vagococcus xieshaowenii]TFZ42100.1 HAD family hydrolase [Vagococcus xieshaowenii]